MPKQNFILRWKKFLSTPGKKLEFISTVFLLITSLILLSNYLLYNEARTGAVINDPLLKYFNPIDLNPVIFFAIYSSLIMGLTSFCLNPEQLMIAFQTYILLVIFRVIAMYLLPLNPPQSGIDLHDPVVFMIGTGQKVTKDLFFSGHTSTAFMLFQVTENKYLKFYFLLATIVVGVSVILQKAHYTIDVLAAVIFSFASFQIIKMLHSKSKKHRILNE